MTCKGPPLSVWNCSNSQHTGQLSQPLLQMHPEGWLCTTLVLYMNWTPHWKTWIILYHMFYRFFTYGNFPLDGHLDYLNAEVLQNFEHAVLCMEVPLESRWTEPVNKFTFHQFTHGILWMLQATKTLTFWNPSLQNRSGLVV